MRVLVSKCPAKDRPRKSAFYEFYHQPKAYKNSIDGYNAMKARVFEPIFQVWF